VSGIGAREKHEGATVRAESHLQMRTLRDMTEMRLDLAARTDPGRQRAHNEDAYLLCDLDAGARASAREIDRKERFDRFVVGERGVLLAVSDGMGGAAAGEIASSISLQSLYDELVRDEEGGAVAERLARVVRHASRRVREAGRGDRRGMGATLTAALFCGSAVHIAQIGDSRAYLLREGFIKQVTHDQSYVQMMVDEGRMTLAEAERSPQRSVIMQVMGQRDDVRVALGRISVRPGDRLLLCSDGLSNAISDDVICKIVHQVPFVRDAAARLVDAANAAGGPDNITVILAKIDAPAEKPLAESRLSDS
jgi:serine/threonine protein phosphatase PrpC